MHTVPQEVAGKPLSAFLDAYRREGRDVADLHAELLVRARRCGGRLGARS